jgi:O-antigen/teichoic acid export membrane protein
MSRIKRTTVVHFSSQVLVSVSGFVATFVIARYLGSDVLGQYALVVAITIWFMFPVRAVSAAVTKRMSEGADPSAFLGAGMATVALLVPVLVGIVLLGAGFLRGYVGARISHLIAVLIAASAGFQIAKDGLDGQKKVGVSGGALATNRVVRTVLQAGIVLLGYGLGGIIAGHIVGLVTAAGLALLFYDVRPTIPSRHHFRSLYEYARYSWLGPLKARSFGWMDTIVLGFFVAPSRIGIYEVAWNLASVLILVSVSIRMTLFPEISDLSAEDRYSEIHEMIEDGILFTGIFAIPGFVGSTVLGPRVLAIYRPEFSRGATILLVLILARFVAAYGTQFLNVIDGIDRPDITFRINALFIVTNLSLNVVLVAAFGWYGAAVATGVSATVLVATSYVAVRQLIGAPRIPGIGIGKELMASLVMGGILLAVRPFVPSGHYVTVALVLFGAVVYGIVLLVLSRKIRDKVLEIAPRAA